MVEAKQGISDEHKPNKPVNWVQKLENFIRANTKYSEDLIKQVSINGSKNPLVRLKLKEIDDDALLNRFMKKPELFLEEFEEALIRVARFDLDFKEVYEKWKNEEKFRGIHIIPDSEGKDWLIPERENLSKDFTQDLNKVLKFKGRFMSLGLERRLEFDKIKWCCLMCGEEFEMAVVRKTREKYRYPSFCPVKSCKATSKKDFMIIPEDSVTYEKRLFTIIDIENRDIVNELQCYISHCIEYFEKKTRNLHTNDEIEVLGLLKMDTADLETQKEEQFAGYYIDVLDINLENSNNINPEIVKDIKKKMQKDQLYCNKIIDSIHPFSQGIINFFPTKLLYILAHVTSDSWDEKRNKRNGINCIVGGHAGTLKSGAARHIKKILGGNNFGIIFGKNTTAKGLVPVAQRNNNEKNLVKRYGAIPYYNRKTFLIDEAHYLYKNDTDALESTKCFEEGVISRALDGTTINAEAKGTIIFALNYQTENEAYDYSESLLKNLGFPEDQRSVLDRFDLHYIIPENSIKMVQLLEIRDDDDYEPRTNVGEDLIYNYLMEAKRVYSTGVKIPKEIRKIIRKIYDLILEEKADDAILNPRESNIIKKVLKAIAALRLRDEVNDEDIDYFKKYLINTIIPFQDNDYILKLRKIEINEIFFNAFDLLTELYPEYFDVSKFISFLREYLEDNFFKKENYKFKQKNLPILGDYIDKEKNLSNNKFRNLLDSNEKIIVEEKGYFIEKMNNKTHFIRKDWVVDKMHQEIEEKFEINDTDSIELKSLIQVLETTMSLTEDFIVKLIEECLVPRLYRLKEGMLIKK
ncbi:MAG: hypothetical protein ACOC1X_00350 [Promethearchaeota archaeon]